MKIRGVMARKGDTPEYVRRMQKELFERRIKMEASLEVCFRAWATYSAIRKLWWFSSCVGVALLSWRSPPGL
ncbi:MAG: hypothetical protein ACYDHX_12455 [Methanothrix sp.]